MLLRKIGKYIFLIVALLFVFLWSIFFEPSGNMGLFVRVKMSQSIFTLFTSIKEKWCYDDLSLFHSKLSAD